MTDEPIIGEPLGAEKTAGEPSTEPTGEPKKRRFEGIKKAISKFREKLNKNAVVAAVLNVSFWGFGYFYNGKRRMFGLLLMSSELVGLVWLYLNPSIRIWKIITDPLVIVSAVLFFFALAYDAYNDAKQESEPTVISEM